MTELELGGKIAELLRYRRQIAEHEGADPSDNPYLERSWARTLRRWKARAAQLEEELTALNVDTDALLEEHSAYRARKAYSDQQRKQREAERQGKIKRQPREEDLIGPAIA